MKFKSSVFNNKEIEQENMEYLVNPLMLQANLSSLSTLSNYNQTSIKPKFDYDSIEILTKVDNLQKLAPKEMTIPYSFDINEINGERIYLKNGFLANVREYDNDIIRDYIPYKGKEQIVQIIERNRISGNIISKIEKIYDNESEDKINVTVYDANINKKYTMFQIKNGVVSSITEFSANGKNFRTLFKDAYNGKPLRYLEAKENKKGEFIFTDAKINSKCEISEIKRVSTEKEICIRYEGVQKIIDVKQKIIDE